MEETYAARFPVYAFVNQKGGCGKTTTAVHLAGALAARGERVLLVDLDPQAHATMGLGCSPDRPTVADVLLEDASLSEAVTPAPGGITLLPAEPRLAEFEEVSGRLIHPERRLALALEEARRIGVRFDHVLLDCSPRADGVLCAMHLRRSHTLLVEMAPSLGDPRAQGARRGRGLRAPPESGGRDHVRPPARRAGCWWPASRLGRALRYGHPHQRPPSGGAGARTSGPRAGPRVPRRR